MVGFIIAAVMLSSELWLDVSYKVFGLADAAIEAVSVLEVIRSTLLVHEMRTFKRESLHHSVAEDVDDVVADVIVEHVCEENELEGELE